MGIIKRGGYFFFTVLGDHDPQHVHIYQDNVLIARFNLRDWVVLTGKVNRKIMRILEDLRNEGKL